MGSYAFRGFLSDSPLTDPLPTDAAAETGVTWGGSRATWSQIVAAAAERAREDVEPGGCYLADVAAGIDALVALLAVAATEATCVVWGTAGTVPVDRSAVDRGLAPLRLPLERTTDRPLWGIATSGTTHRAKIALGHADLWEAVALLYDGAVYRPAFGGRTHGLATNLPPQFSAVFFMAVLPAMLFRRELTIAPAGDWAALEEAQRDTEVFLLSVPALAAAACLAPIPPARLDRSLLVLGGGHVSGERVDAVRGALKVPRVWNIYGSAETGCISIDPSPGHNRHVGRPIPGKPVWVVDPGPGGSGSLRVAGPDCCRYVWDQDAGTVTDIGTSVGADHGQIDAEGNVVLEGRLDDGEKLRGRLVYPREVERHLLALGGVVDARVWVDHQDNGLERLAALVVGSTTPRQVHAHCAQLPEHSRPVRVKCLSAHDAVDVYSSHGKLRSR